jgi:16S rRNA processing protein RimM
VTRPEAGVLAKGLRVAVAGVNHELVRLAGTDAKPIVRLRALATREAVEALRGEPMMAARSVMPLEEDEYWADDLVGLEVVDGEQAVGVVDRVRSLPSCEVLEVGELLIPLVSDAVRDVDLKAGRIDVDLHFLDAR